MKKKYTKRQIVEAIAFWKKQLKKVNEAGLSPDQLLARFDAKKQSNAEEQRRAEADRNKQVIDSIWVKTIRDKNHRLITRFSASIQTIADLEITYCGTGKKEDTEFDVTHCVDDTYYKQLKRMISASRKAAEDKTPVTEDDVVLAMIHTAFGDSRIKWFYGPNKHEEQEWLFKDEADDYAEDNDIGYGSERFMEEWRDAKMSGSSDPWGDAEIACGMRRPSDFYSPEDYDI